MVYKCILGTQGIQWCINISPCAHKIHLYTIECLVFIRYIYSPLTVEIFHLSIIKMWVHYNLQYSLLTREETILYFYSCLFSQLHLGTGTQGIQWCINVS
jgi:hypothetical protein